MHNQINTECLLHILPEIEYFILYTMYYRSTYLYCRNLVQSTCYPWGLDHPRRTKGSSSGWLHHLVATVHHQPTGWSVWRSLLLGVRSVADQLIGLLGARRPVILTSCLDFIVSFTGVLASRARDSLAFVFFVHKFPAELGVPLVVGFCYIFASLRLS
jgi:hypothetical protein